MCTLPACASRCDMCDGDGCDDDDSDEVLVFEKSLDVDSTGEYAFAGISYRNDATGQEWSAIHVVELATGAVNSLVVSAVENGGIGGAAFVAEGCGGLCLVPTTPPFAVTTTAFSGTFIAMASSNGEAAILGEDGTDGFIEIRGTGPLTRVSVISDPLGLTLGAGFAYVVGGSADQVSVVRLSNGTEELRVPLPCAPAGPAGVLSGTNLLFGCESGGLMEFDPFTLSSAALASSASAPNFVSAGAGYGVASFNVAGGETSLYEEGAGIVGLPVASLLVDDAVFTPTSVFVALESGVSRLSLADGTSGVIPGLEENDPRPRIARLPGGGVAVLAASRLVLLDESGDIVGSAFSIPIPPP